MKIAYNWLKKYINLTLSPSEVAEKLTDVGLEVEEEYEYSTVPPMAAGLLIGKVQSIIPHPNAERLRITKVDVGLESVLNIVCGAPNVEEGQKVIVATIGTELNPTKGESFKIGKSKIRGEASEGMICAEDEIGLGTSHNGIIVLPQDAKIGMPYKDYVSGYRDYIFEIGLTPNRVDAANHIGVARDLSALLDIPLNYPILNDRSKDGAPASIEIQIEAQKECIRYSGVIVRGITLKESPDWLKNHLISVGLKPINNIVDITNFIMFEGGQPLHAFDLDIIKDNKITIRLSKNDEKLTTLDHIERQLKGNELLICNSTEPIAMAGIMGSLHSRIKEGTQDIFIESACFAPSTIRTAARQHTMFTDASFRFERGSDPNATIDALKRAVDIILEIAGGEVEDHLYDVYPQPIENNIVDFSMNYLDRIAGNNIDRKEVETILTRLEIKILKKESENWLLEIPSFKQDVNRAVDVAEEILRIYSYNRINFGNQVKSVVQPDPNYSREKLRRRLSEFLTAKGFYESYNLSFVPNDFQVNREGDDALSVLNPLSAETKGLRDNMLLAGMKMLEHNVNRQQSDIRFFEWGSVHHKHIEGYRETQFLALWLSGEAEQSRWNSKSSKIDFFWLKGIVESILKIAGISQTDFTSSSDDVLEIEGNFFKNQKILARFGKVNDEHIKEFGFDIPVFYAEIDGQLLLKGQKPIVHSSYSRFPRVKRDLALVVPDAINFQAVKDVIRQTEKQLLQSISLFDVYKGAQVNEGHKSYAVRLEFENKEQTLEDKIVDKIINRITAALEHKLNIKIR